MADPTLAPTLPQKCHRQTDSHLFLFLTLQNADLVVSEGEDFELLALSFNAINMFLPFNSVFTTFK